MKEHPIICSAPMVRAILAGRETQIRHAVKFPSDFDGMEIYDNGRFGLKYSSSKFEGCVERLRPKWEVGDRLWVRETWQHTDFFGLHSSDDNAGYIYRADENGVLWENTPNWKWRASTQMPRAASRITLEIADVRAERLQDVLTWVLTFKHITNGDETR